MSARSTTRATSSGGHPRLEVVDDLVDRPPRSGASRTGLDDRDADGPGSALREALSRGRAVIDRSLEQALLTLGARDPHAGAGAIMACAEGLILHRIGRHDDGDVRPVLELVVGAAFP